MSKLKKFIERKMRMSHIYQPVMIKTLLTNDGKADKNLIAKKNSRIRFFTSRIL